MDRSWVRIAFSVRGFVISDIDRMSVVMNPRTLEAMRTQYFPRGIF